LAPGAGAAGVGSRGADGRRAAAPSRGRSLVRPSSRRRRSARDLGVEEHVIFHNRFVDHQELMEFLGAADIYVCPYLNEAQITSGTLAWAVGAGKAVISTPYWYAQELLADGRGRLLPFGDSAAMAANIIEFVNCFIQFLFKEFISFNI
jgi:glycosyltransferase involved in cell wall biosynthesis